MKNYSNNPQYNFGNPQYNLPEIREYAQFNHLKNMQCFMPLEIRTQLETKKEPK